MLGSYDIPFYLAGACFLLCGLMHCLLFLPYFDKKRPGDIGIIKGDPEQGRELHPVNGYVSGTDGESDDERENDAVKT